MPDRTADTETWICTAPVRAGGMTLVVLAREVRRVVHGRRHAWLSIERRPRAVLVRDAFGVRALDTTGATLALEPLRQRIPDLDWGLAPDPPG